MGDIVIVMPADNAGIKVGYLAGKFPGKVGHLCSPRKGGRMPNGPYDFLPYALDNGRFAAGVEWSEEEWIATLNWARLSGLCPRWALVPDFVGDREATLREWGVYSDRVAAYGWPLAFAVQDGMVPSDVPSEANVVFVGGSTEWKWRTLRMWCGSFPRVHVGRVNSYERLWQCEDARAESCDGTGWFRGDHGSGKPWRSLLAYMYESTRVKPRLRQGELEEGLLTQEVA